MFPNATIDLALKKKLLFVSYYFPPLHSIASIRNYYFAFNFQRRFDQVHVYTTSNGNLFSKEEFPIDNLQVTGILTCDYRTIFSWFSGKRTIHHSEGNKRNLFIQFLLKLNDTLPFSILFGEGGLLFIMDAYFRAVKLIKHEKITHCFSVFRPTANHIVVYLLKKRFPHLIWVADFHDTPVDYYRSNGYLKSTQWYWYKRLLSKADQITTVSEGLRNQLDRLGKDIKVVRDGIIPRLYKNSNADKFIVSYTGSLYFGIQTGDLLFQALSSLVVADPDFANDLQLSYAGKDAALWQQWMQQHQLSDFFVDHGMVSRTEAMELQDQASINLLLTWSFPESKGIVTGKIYEYLAASKPILLLINGETDTEMEAWFSELACGKVCYNNNSQQRQIESFILEVYDLWKATKLSKPFIAPEKIQAMSWENQLKNMVNEIS